MSAQPIRFQAARGPGAQAAAPRPLDEAWYPVEASGHVARGQVLQAHLHGLELAVWRSEAGALEVWEDRCPHRSVRLSLGFVAGEELVCRYHGWRYGRDGHCTAVPSSAGGAATGSACARTYLSRERQGLVWVSLSYTPPGDPPMLPAEARPARSFTVDADASALQASAAGIGLLPGPDPGPDPTIWQLPDTGPAGWLVLQPMQPGVAGIHLLQVPDQPASGAAPVSRQDGTGHLSGRVASLVAAWVAASTAKAA